MDTSGLVFIALVIAFGIIYLGIAVKELLTTLKRIEARMTLLNPLEEEKKVLEGSGILNSSTRWEIRDRAIQPAIWWRMYYEKTKDLRGKERKEARKDWEYQNRKYRN
jgi:hypothetical protein